MPSRRPPAAAVPRLLMRGHQPTPGRWPCLMAAGGGTRRRRRRRRRQGAASQAAMGSSQENQANRDFSVPVASERPGSLPNAASSVLCLPCRFPGSGALQASFAKVLRASRWRTRRCRSMSERTRGGRSWKETGVSEWRPMPSGPWRIGRHRWPGRVTEVRPGHGPPDTPRRTAVHPILVGRTDSHDQRKGWIAWRLAVDL